LVSSVVGRVCAGGGLPSTLTLHEALDAPAVIVEHRNVLCNELCEFSSSNINPCNKCLDRMRLILIRHSARADYADRSWTQSTQTRIHGITTALTSFISRGTPLGYPDNCSRSGSCIAKGERNCFDHDRKTPSVQKYSKNLLQPIPALRSDSIKNDSIDATGASATSNLRGALCLRVHGCGMVSPTRQPVTLLTLVNKVCFVELLAL
jgi:hypothetical protein